MTTHQTITHDAATCTLGPGGEKCWMCSWAIDTLKVASDRHDVEHALTEAIVANVQREVFPVEHPPLKSLREVEHERKQQRIRQLTSRGASAADLWFDGYREGLAEGLRQANGDLQQVVEARKEQQ